MQHVKNLFQPLDYYGRNATPTMDGIELTEDEIFMAEEMGLSEFIEY